jgi:hypothetical protein
MDRGTTRTDDETRGFRGGFIVDTTLPLLYVITGEGGEGDQRVKELEWKMRRRGGGRRGKEPEWAMGRIGRGGELDGCIMHQVPTSFVQLN